MDAHPINKTEALAALPPEWPHALMAEIKAASGAVKLVVLDDDPTGTQTVYDIPVLTEWSVPSLARELAGEAPGFFILTNSRAMPLTQAQALNREIGQNLRKAAQQAGVAFSAVSRSDSTLRGHYPGEVTALAGALGPAPDATLIVPFFLEGGRFTVNDVHYVAEGDVLMPAAMTPFARDAAFGYTHSNLRNWVVEKGARSSGMDVYAIAIDMIRRGGPQAVCNELCSLFDDAVCVVNSASLRDMEVFARGVQLAEARGKRFVFRTAASFVQARLGLPTQPLLTPASAALPTHGGALIVAGSYVPKTTGQLNALLALPDIAKVEVHVPALLADVARNGELARAGALVAQALGAGQDVVLYTSRDLVKGSDGESSLHIGNTVSAGLVEIVRGLQTRPRYVVAKGGITSSDIATKALGIRRAMVMGQALPGVPVWRAGDESKWPGMAYVVFPGNVGGETALVDLVKGWQTG